MTPEQTVVLPELPNSYIVRVWANGVEETLLAADDAREWGLACYQAGRETGSDVVRAAQAVLDRWNSPKWEWAKQGPTADLMFALDAAIRARK